MTVVKMVTDTINTDTSVQNSI